VQFTTEGVCKPLHANVIRFLSSPNQGGVGVAGESVPFPTPHKRSLSHKNLPVKSGWAVTQRKYKCTCFCSKVTSGNTLWNRFYKTYASRKIVPKEAEEQADHYGWKTVFLVHRLQDNVSGNIYFSSSIEHLIESNSTPLSRDWDGELPKVHSRIPTSTFFLFTFTWTDWIAFLSVM